MPDQILRIGTWNINPRRIDPPGGPGRAWGYALKKMKCDILLFQEGDPPLWIRNQVGHLAFKARPGGLGMVGVYCPEFKVEQLTQAGPSSKSQYLVAEVKMPNDPKPLIVISVYGTGKRGEVIPNLHTMMSELSPILLDQRRSRAGPRSRVIFAGNLNASPEFDKDNNQYRPHSVFFVRLELDFGLVDAFKQAGVEDFVQTVRNRGASYPKQTDWLFTSKSIARNLLECRAVENGLVQAASNHNLVMAYIELPDNL